MVTFEEFKKLTSKEQLEMIETHKEEVDNWDVPFWFERISTAIEKKNPYVVSSLGKEFMDIYNNIVDYKRKNV